MLEFLPVPGTGVELSTHLVSNADVYELFNVHRVRNLDRGTYRFLNVFNPEQPLREVAPGRWEVSREHASWPVVGINAAGGDWCAAALGGRLPTTSEWQTAAGGATYPWGDDPPTPELANYAELVGAPTPTGTYPPTGSGWFDLAGNVAEWCAGERLAGERTVVGGGWNKPETQLQTHHTRSKWARVGTMSIGFRCARPLSAHKRVALN